MRARLPIPVGPLQIFAFSAPAVDFSAKYTLCLLSTPYNAHTFCRRPLIPLLTAYIRIERARNLHKRQAEIKNSIEIVRAAFFPTALAHKAEVDPFQSIVDCYHMRISAAPMQYACAPNVCNSIYISLLA